MRFDAFSELGRRRWFIWHCEEARRIDNCVWVDDDTNQYGVHDIALIRKTLNDAVITIQAKKIVIDIPSLVIYINPVDLNDETETECTSLLIET